MRITKDKFINRSNFITEQKKNVKHLENYILNYAHKKSSKKKI